MTGYITEEQMDEFIEFVEKYPSLSRAQLFAFYPDLDKYERHPLVLKKQAAKNMKLDDEARARGLDNELDQLKIDEELRQAKHRAIEIVKKVMSNDKSVTPAAVKMATQVLGREFSRAKRLGEMEAEKLARENTGDESYPEPSGTASPMDVASKV